MATGVDAACVAALTVYRRRADDESPAGRAQRAAHLHRLAVTYDDRAARAVAAAKAARAEAERLVEPTAPP